MAKLLPDGWNMEVPITTGTAKAVPLTWANLGDRTALRDLYFPIDGPVLSLMQPAAAGGLQTCLTALKHGLSVDLSDTAAGFLAAVADPALQSIIGSPAQLATLIRGMDALSLTARHVQSCLLMGGAVSKTLQDAADRVFGASVLAMYGTTELGACATYTGAEAAHPMRLLAGTQAQAVNDAGQVLAEGEEGLLRIKAAGMVQQYFGAASLTAATFRDGWFYPGDTGWVKDGQIRLTGRRDEQINLGGAKFNPGDIDQYIQTLGLTVEGAAFKHTDAQGLETLMIAVVAPDDASYTRLKADIRAAIKPLNCPVGFFRVDAIARNAMGKPLRNVLAGQLQAVMKRRP